MRIPLRVLHVVVNMNRGGAETLLMNLYRNIDRSKVQFDFLTCKEGVFDEEIRELGGEIHRIQYITDVGHFGYIKALNKFFSSNNNYKIVHAHMDKMSGLVLRAAKHNNIPVRIAHSHSTRSEGSFFAKLYKWYAGILVLSSSTHLLACSNTAARWLFLHKAKMAKVLKNGIESNKFIFSENTRHQVRQELKLEDNVVIGHIGRFNHPKNHLFLIEVFSQLTKAIPNATLVLIGDGDLRTDIECKINKLKIGDKVKLLGIRSDINRLVQAIDIFVFPSLYEGLPVTLIEAQTAGVPCVISDVITREVDIGFNLIDYLPLNDKLIWIEHLKKKVKLPIERGIFKHSMLKKEDYDIKKSVDWIQDYYFTKLR